MFIPIRSDRPLRTTPYVNYALVVICIIAYGLTHRQLEEGSQYKYQIINRVYNQLYNEELSNRQSLDEIALSAEEENRILREANIRANELTREKYPLHSLMLHKYGTAFWQFLTYQFLHGSPMHLIGNLIFLWVFGNAVEDRLGKVGYLFFYLAMGVLAGMGHWLTSDAPVLGASGSIAGVTGAFLALFPRTRITFLYFFFFIGAFEVPAMLVVVFYFVKDLLFFGMDVGGNVAYTAHLAGNVAGFVVGMALLWPRILPREPYDLFSLWTHKRRRDKFKKLAGQGYQAWEGQAHSPGEAGGKRRGKLAAKPMTEQDKIVMEQRQEISRAVGNHDLAEASRMYLQLLDAHGDQTLSQRHQFEIANHLAGQGEHAAAARAYELLLKAYPRHDDRAHVQLMLGLINARYLDRSEQAKPLLQEASQRLHGEDAQLARQLLAEIG